MNPCHGCNGEDPRMTPPRSGGICLICVRLLRKICAHSKDLHVRNACAPNNLCAQCLRAACLVRVLLALRKSSVRFPQDSFLVMLVFLALRRWGYGCARSYGLLAHARAVLHG